MMPGREYQAQPSRFGFNGKENDNDVKGFENQQDYGMRIYDTRIARFLSADPLAAQYAHLTPYQFASNRPVDGIDLDGMEYYNYRLTKQSDNTTKLELIDVKSAKPSYGGTEYSHHRIEYNGTTYYFNGGNTISPFANSFKAIVPFVADPDQALKAGIVKSNEEAWVDWGIFNLQQSVFELAGANTTFALKNGTLRVYSAKVGESTSNDYRGTFFETNTELKGQVIVHHAIEQQIDKLYPNTFTKSQINSLLNLRGVKLDDNNVLHLSIIRRLWNAFYRDNPTANAQQIIEQATKIDKDYGKLFSPVVNTESTSVSSGGFNFSRGLILMTGMEEREALNEKNKKNK